MLTGKIGAGLYGSPSSQSGGVAAMSIGDSCDDVVDALERLGDMWTDRVECMERSDDAGECEFASRPSWNGAVIEVGLSEVHA